MAWVCVSEATTPRAIDEKRDDPQTEVEQDNLASEGDALPYWLVNVPRSLWPAECPAFLRNQPAKNIRILSTPDNLYGRQSWETAKEIIRTNRIDLFQRVPSDLRKYLEYTAAIKEKYGSVMKFVVQERLGWGNGGLKPRGRPFEYDEDVKILYNDWPYGVDPGIVHLVVWTKFELEDDPATDDLTPQARAEIEKFVTRTFRSRVSSENVIWFKNWRSLKSIHSVEHFHVMLKDPNMEFVKEITNGDVPLIAKR